VTEAHVCEQTARSSYMKAELPEAELPTISWSRCPNHPISTPHFNLALHPHQLHSLLSD